MTATEELAEVIAEAVGVALKTQADTHAEEIAALRAEFDERIKAIPAASDGIDGINGRDGFDGLAGMNGIDGIDGARGLDGRDGRDGKDGIASRDEVRAEATKAVEGLRAELLIEVKKAAAEEVAALPTMQHKGVWKDGEYVAGSCVSWAGSTWHAVSKTSEKPGDGATAWVLIAKRGNPGKDAR